MEEASPREQLLWKPFPLLEESVVVQDHGNVQDSRETTVPDLVQIVFLSV